jgi:hypothetical protein
MQMDWIFYPGLNNPTRANETREASEEYFRQHDDIRRVVENHLRARYEIDDLIPQTEDSFGSGHFFPFSESYFELEASLVLSVFGFYRHALASLRAAFELSLVGVFYDRADQAASAIQQWIRSEQKAYFRNMIKELRKTIPRYAMYCDCSNFQEVLKDMYDKLSGFVHVRGYPYSSSRFTSANFNQFSEESLKGYIGWFCQVARCSVILILLKYPIGMQSVPLMSKFGLNPPAGGFLDAEAQAAVLAILREDEQLVLQAISDADPKVREIVEQIEAMPDLTPEEWEQQAKRLKGITL